MKRAPTFTIHENERDGRHFPPPIVLNYSTSSEQATSFREQVAFGQFLETFSRHILEKVTNFSRKNLDTLIKIVFQHY